MYIVNSRTEIIEQSTTRKIDKMGGWSAINQGTADATINGITLAAGEGITDFLHLHPSVIWNSPIKIECTPGAKVIFTYLLYKEVATE